jgi:hypothetical protein
MKLRLFLFIVSIYLFVYFFEILQYPQQSTHRHSQQTASSSTTQDRETSAKDTSKIKFSDCDFVLKPYKSIDIELLPVMVDGESNGVDITSPHASYMIYEIKFFVDDINLQQEM